MAVFHYSAVTANGDLVKGKADAASMAELLEFLRSRNLTLHRAREVPPWLLALRPGKLNAELTAEFCYFLSEYIRAGADLRLSLQDMSRAAPSARVRSLSQNLLARIERGDSLSVALRDSRAVPPMVVNLARVGEETGRLDMVLASAARHYEQLVQMRSALLRALLYPALALIMLLAAAAFWIGYVLPKLATLFETLMPQLPPSTRAVLDGAAWMRLHWPLILLVLLVLLVAIPLLMRHRAMRPVNDAVKWQAPVYWRLERARVYYLFFANLGVMYAAGMTLTRSLEVLRRDPGNRLFGRRLSGMTERIRQGSSLSQAMQSSRAFESIAVGMARLGESTGSLATQSERLGDYYQQKLKAQIDFVVRMFEPLVLLLIGLLLILVVVTIVSPIYDLAQHAARGIRP